MSSGDWTPRPGESTGQRDQRILDYAATERALAERGDGPGNSYTPSSTPPLNLSAPEWARALGMLAGIVPAGLAAILILGSNRGEATWLTYAQVALATCVCCGAGYALGAVLYGLRKLILALLCLGGAFWIYQSLTAQPQVESAAPVTESRGTTAPGAKRAPRPAAKKAMPAKQ